MPAKYHIPVRRVPPRLSPLAKTTIIDWNEGCLRCQRCVKEVCPVDAMVAKRKGWLIRAGGKHGKHPIFAYEVAQFATDEQIPPLIEKTIAWYQANSKGRERIGSAIGRLNLSKYLDEVVKPLGLEVVETPEQRQKFWASGNMYNEG